MSQVFLDFSSFSKKIQHPVLSIFSQNAQNEVLAKNEFFANDFALLDVSISQRPSAGRFIPQQFLLAPSS